MITAKLKSTEYVDATFQQRILTKLQSATEEGKESIEIDKLPNCLHIKLIEEGYVVKKFIRKQYYLLFFKRYVKVYRISHDKFIA